MIRLYGIVVGQNSLTRVTAGVREALTELGVLAGFVPVDQYDEDASYEGGEAAVGVLTAPCKHAWLMKAIGRHGQRLALLPPNSTWVPEKLMDVLRSQVTGLLAPSKWAAGILEPYAIDYGLRVSIWEHGVDAGFARNEREADQRRNDYAGGDFDVLHLSSTDRERKGSRELIEGWVMAVKLKLLGGHPHLVLSADDPTGKLRETRDRAAGGNEAIRSSVIFTRSRMEYTVAEAAKNYRSHHMLCQPSRGEAFGMCGLEARACGVPIISTECTGHSAYLRAGDPGVVVVPTGPLAPIDDGPGALAPSLEPSAICDALGEAHASWPDLQDFAMAYAPVLSERWSWTEVTRRWLSAYPILSDWPKERKSEER
jgi:glycosyltransferase involved in cell wall biosynthesis